MPQSNPADMKLRLLVVDDRPTRSGHLIEVLRGLGHEAFAHPTLDSAPSDFDLAFVSITAASSERVTALKKKAPTAPVLALVDRLADVDPRLIASAGVEDVVPSPFTHTALHAKLAIWSPHRRTSSRFVLDLDSLRELEKLSLGDGSGLVPTLIDLFHSSRSDIETLCREFAKGDLDATRALAHNLKSSAANLGLVRLKCICHKIELAQTDEDMRLSVALLPKEFELAKRHLTRAGYTTGLPKTA